MKVGQNYVGCDGTIYVVVSKRSVRADQFRWWVDKAWAFGRLAEYSGPESVADLHLMPACDCGAVAFALVLP